MLNICNHYPATVWVTIMWYTPNCPDGGNWTKAGWWMIEPGQCKTVFGGSLRKVNRYFYYHAHTASGVNWSGPYVHPVPRRAFNWCERTSSTDSRNVGYRLLDIGRNDNYKLNLTP